jgi:hypothetical protein
MLTVTLLGGGVLLLLLKTGRRKSPASTDSLAMQTAQNFINVKDIRDKYLYTKDGMLFIFLRVHSISIDLYSKAEKNTLIKSLTAELSDIQHPFKFIALSRPVDISPLIADMTEMLKAADDKRKELLRQEILQMSSYALSGEVVERQFYVELKRTKTIPPCPTIICETPNLSNKARGLLSTMLSLPDNWDYTTRGLARICKDGVDGISSRSRRTLRDPASA